MFFSKRGLKIKRKKVDIGPDEILIDALGEEKDLANQPEVPIGQKSVFIFSLLFLSIISLVFLRSFQFQILEHDKMLELSQKNQFISRSIKSQRGIIYDANLTPLVFNRSSASLYCDKDEFLKNHTNPQETIKNLASVLNVDPIRISDLIREENKEIILVPNLDYSSSIIFEALSENFSGIYIKNESVRDYQKSQIFSHILGYYRKSGSITGLENSYNEILDFASGKIVIERDAKGRIISEKIESLPEAGQSLVLWIDAELQEKLYETIKNKLKDIGASKAVGIAMNPNTGGILALVSIPSYDNNLFSWGILDKDWQALQNDKSKPLLNRAISAKYPTGSTIKPLIAAAALEEKIISENLKFDCQGRIVVDNPYFPDKPYIFNDWRTHGLTSVTKAIAESCNVFFFTIGGGYKNFKGLGVEKIKDYLEKFGWNQKTAIDLPGEVEGFIPDKEWKKNRFSPPNNTWYPGDTYNLSIGQGYIGITPIEVISSVSALANGGRLLKPKLAKAVIDENKNIIQEFEPEIIREDIASQKTIEIVKRGMREGVTYGSSLMLNNLPVEAASKTGTAETGKKDVYHNWVTVFAPYKNPEIVLTILVEEVKGIQVATLPIARDVLNWYFTKESGLEK